MKKNLFAALLVAGTTLGFAKEVKTEGNKPNEKSFATKILKKDSKFPLHVFYYYTTSNPDGTIDMHVVDMWIDVPM
ncbi:MULTISPECIES: hypothetical protein [Chryseobacterium]|uniref:hypothetical protein n=1 Tax=Chryseobacterium TaxID=59732 RepID=UPI003984A197